MSDSDKPDDANGPNPLIKGLQLITPNLIRRSFAIKFGLVLFVMAASIAAIGLFATNTVVSQTQEDAKAQFRNVAEQQANTVEQWLDRNVQQVRLLSANQVWSSNKGEVLKNRLQTERLGLSGDIHHMHVVDVKDGGTPVIAGSTKFEQNLVSAGTPFTSGDRSWFQSQLSTIQDPNGNGETSLDEVFVSDPYRAEDQTVIAFVSPATGVDNRFLVIEVSVLGFQSESLRGASKSDVGYTQVINNRTYHGEKSPYKVMLDARGKSGKLLKTYATDNTTLEPVRKAHRLRGPDTGVAGNNDENEVAGVIAEMPANQAVIDEPYTVGYAPINITTSEDILVQVTPKDWVVVTHGPRSEVFGFVDTLAQQGKIVTAIAALFITITGSLLGISTARAIDNLTTKTEEMREGNLDVTLYSSRVDNIGQLYDGFADMRDALKKQIQEAEQSRKEAESARKEAEVARAEAEELATYLQKKAEEYSEIMQEVGAGDLTQRMSKDGEEESMDQIAEEFNDMIGELEKTTGQLKSYVDEVEEAGAEVEQSAGTVRKASEQVADSIQKISDDAYDQKERLQHVSEAMDEITADIERFADSQSGVEMDESLEQIQDIATDINEIAELSEETMAEAENVAGAAEQQAAELNEVSERANDLQRYAQPLRDILGRFETEAEHEFVFSVGPTGGAASPGSSGADDEE